MFNEHFFQPICSNMLCLHEVYQVPLLHSNPVNWFMRCHNNVLHADSCPSISWQNEEANGAGPFRRKWETLAGMTTRVQYQWQIHTGQCEKTHAYCTCALKMHTNGLTHSWPGSKIKKKHNLNKLLAILYFCTVWPWKTQIRGHCITVPVNSPLCFRKSPYGQPLSSW